MKFAGKVVLVTGGSEGLGKGIAEAFLNEGAQVVINCLRQDKLARALDDLWSRTGAGEETLTGITCDVGDSAAVAAMFATVRETFGVLDILVNNAARTPSDTSSVQARFEAMELMTSPVPRHSLHVTREMTDEAWLAMINTNLNGVFFCTREALRLMEPRRYGKIINIASTAGISGTSFHSPHYSASKGGVVAFTRSVGIEVIGDGINVNCIAAGGVATQAWEDAAARYGEQFQQRLMQLIPAGRLGTIGEFASLALYLASDDAAYLVGQTISPNGGTVT